MTEERLLTGNSCTAGQGWREEAAAVIQDIHDHVNVIRISELLPCDNSSIFLNLETKESVRITVQMSAAGFRICGQSFDSMSMTESRQYETMNALLDETSPGFRNSFANALHQKLANLHNSRHDHDWDS